LESYLFTREALADIKNVLKPDGVFVTYNFFRQGWIVERVAAMAEAVWGVKPLILSLPYLPSLTSSDRAGFTMIIATRNPAIAQAFQQRGAFWLHPVPPQNTRVNGFTVRPEKLPPAERARWQKIVPTALVHDSGAPVLATDDWPFL